MTGFKKLTVARQNSYNSLYVNPLTESRHSRSCSEGGGGGEGVNSFAHNNENADPNKKENSGGSGDDKENAAPSKNGNLVFGEKKFPALKSLSTKGSSDGIKQVSHFKSLSTGRVLKPSSLEFCMQMNEPDKAFGLRVWDANDSEHSNSLKIWDYSDSEAAPASSWSTLPNRSIYLCTLLLNFISRRYVVVFLFFDL